MDIEYHNQESVFIFLQGEDAFVHMCKVASGLDSQVLGEQEIFGQYKNAIQISKKENWCHGI